MYRLICDMMCDGFVALFVNDDNEYVIFKLRIMNIAYKY